MPAPRIRCTIDNIHYLWLYLDIEVLLELFQFIEGVFLRHIRDPLAGFPREGEARRSDQHVWERDKTLATRNPRGRSGYETKTVWWCLRTRVAFRCVVLAT